MASGTATRKWLHHASIYAIGDLLTKSARYLLYPIFVIALQPEQIGQIAVWQAIMMITWAIATLGFGAAVRRFYFPDAKLAANQAPLRAAQHAGQHAGQDPRPVQGDLALVSSLWWARSIIAGLLLAGVCVVLVPTARYWCPVLAPLWIVAAMWAGYFRASTEVVESWYLIQEQPKKLRGLTFAQFAWTTSLVALLIFGLGWGVAGVVLGELIGAATWFVVCGYLASRHARPSLSGVRWREIFRYSLPLVPHSLCMWLLVGGDRIVLPQWIDKASLGIYDVGYFLASILSVIAQAIRAAWLPDFFRTASHVDGPSRYARRADWFFMIVIGAAAAIGLVSPELIRGFAGPTYEASQLVSRIVLGAVVAQAIFMALNQPLLYTGRTAWLGCFSLFGVLVNLLLLWLLVPRMGLPGAALATLLAYASMTIANGFLSRHSYPIPWNYAGLCGLLAIFAGCMLFADFLTLAPLAGMIVKLFVAIAVALLMFAWIRCTRRWAWSPALAIPLSRGGG
jgi:O-antigen/teichoic acid export membrane protein